jgi:hypothetical protein
MSLFQCAIVFIILNTIVIAFQFGLALGMPWGAASMGGKYPGKYPTKMRFLAVFNALTLISINIIVLSKSQVISIISYPFSKINLNLGCCCFLFPFNNIEYLNAFQN